MIEIFGGEFLVRDRGALQSCVAHPRMKLYGEACYPSLAHKAAAYCFFVVKGHPFLDGNKRTGYVAGLHFMHLNRSFPTGIDQDVAERVIKDVASRVDSNMSTLIPPFE